MKLIVSLSFFMFSSALLACPILQGRYHHCHSEIRQMKGEYIIDQHQENDYQVYNVQYIDDETGQSREDVIKSNSQKISRKETLPRVGVTVRIDASARCDAGFVTSDAEVYFLGAHVGSFVSKIYLEGKLLKSDADGSYLGRDVHKRIVCELKE